MTRVPAKGPPPAMPSNTPSNAWIVLVCVDATGPIGPTEYSEPVPTARISASGLAPLVPTAWSPPGAALLYVAPMTPLTSVPWSIWGPLAVHVWVTRYAVAHTGTTVIAP